MIRFASLATAALLVLAPPAQAFDLNAMSAAEREAFGAQVRAYLMENPQVIIEAVNQLEQRQADAQAEADFDLVRANKDDLFNDGYSWVGGNPDGDITIVEFMDYRCGYCRRAAPELAAVLADDPNIRVIIKEFPILGEESLISSRFAIATRQVAGGDAYKAVHDALLEFSGQINDVSLRRLAQSLDLDADAILERMQHDSVTMEIAETRALAQRLQIQGTPSFVLQDELLRGFLPADQMALRIADKREG